MQDLEPGSGSQGGQDAELEEGEIGGFDHCHHPNPTITICLRLLDPPITSVQEIQVPELYQNNPFKNTAVWKVEGKAPLGCRWIKLANFFNSHQDVLNDFEPPPATVPEKHLKKLKKPDWDPMQEVAKILCFGSSVYSSGFCTSTTLASVVTRGNQAYTRIQVACRACSATL